MDRDAKRRLEKNLRKTGLVEPIIWNERTGHVVSGHLRLSILDELADNKGYLLDVSVVNLSPAEEKQQNVFMNNPTAQGQWDTEALFALLKDTEVDFKAAGFESLDLEVILGEDYVKQLLDRPAIANIADEGLVAAAEEEDLTRRDRDEKKTAERIVKEAAEEARKKTPEYIEEQIAAKRKVRETTEDKEFYCVLVFQNQDQRKEFVSFMGYDPSLKYVDGAVVLEKLRPTGSEVTSPVEIS